MAQLSPDLEHDLRRRRPQKAKGSRKTSERLAVDLKLQILTALDYLGGVKWLIDLGKTNPNTFAMLLARILPMVADGNAAGLQIVVNTHAPDPAASRIAGVINSPVLTLVPAPEQAEDAKVVDAA